VFKERKSLTHVPNIIQTTRKSQDNFTVSTAARVISSLPERFLAIGGKKKVAKTLNNWYKHILSLLDKII
jgi:hypothetical protein